jgi:hypothetical protein
LARKKSGGSGTPAEKRVLLHPSVTRERPIFKAKRKVPIQTLHLDLRARIDIPTPDMANYAGDDEWLEALGTALAEAVVRMGGNMTYFKVNKGIPGRRRLLLLKP